jgi:putative ABC transport system permease protein
MEALWQDLRYAVRMLIKRPGFTVAAVLTLGLGIGANTAIFSVVNGALLRPLPFNDPDRLAMIWTTNQPRGVQQDDVSLDDYLDWRNRNQVFEQIAAFGPWGFNITGEGEPEKITSVVVTPNLFQTLGVNPALGRDFSPEDATPEGANVVMISDRLWQRRYGQNPDLIGQALKLDGKSYMVIGIMPAQFRFPNSEVDMWAPLNLTTDESSRRTRWLKVIARIKAEAGLQQARTEIAAIAGQLGEQFPATNVGWRTELAALPEMAVKDSRLALLLLFGAVGFVLLIACVNVANLMLGRVESRRKEMAIRAALGARPRSIVRLLLAESGLLSLAGGAIGALFALWSLDLLLATFPSEPFLGPDDLSLLQLNKIALDARVLGFAFLLSALTAVIFGLLPALKASRPHLLDELKEGGKSVAPTSHSRLRSVLVAAEVALTLVLLVGGGLLIRSFTRLIAVDPGFRTEGVLTFRLSPFSKYRGSPERLAYYRQVIDRISVLPGVKSVGATTSLPFSGTDLSAPFVISGRPPSNDRPMASFHSITPDYLSTMGIRLMRGRAFTERDVPEAPPVALINETMARRYWRDEDPLGQGVSIRFGGNSPLEIVGIVSDTQQTALEAAVKPEVYVPYTQRPWFFMTFAVHTSVNPSDLAGPLRSQVWGIDRDIPIYSVTSVAQRVADSVAQRRFNMFLFGGFGVLALMLAAVGIYGVVSYSVSQRTYEIGVRLALGAKPADVMKLVIREGMANALVGALVGVVAAVGLTRFLSTQLFGVTPTDPLTFAAVASLLIAVALLACYLPARRATKVDPMIALRYE